MDKTDSAYPLQVVNCKDEHAPQIIELLYCLYRELDEGNAKQATSFLNEDFLRNILNAGKTTIIGVFDKDEMVGLITLTESSAVYAGGIYGSIDELYIRPTYRCRGIGKILIDEAKKIAVQRQWQRVAVNTPKNDIKWEATIRFYNSNGFETTGRALKFFCNNKVPATNNKLYMHQRK